ncbi:MAG TPA: M20/M25/M40 family metallo-hydrolase [Candidatus Angelobacter sp.]|nr:M20/M25/M40 family metallo-hydrolase [Candidatus Angelobacter sp.]
MPLRPSSTDTRAPVSPQQEVTRIAAARSVHSAFLYLHNQEMEFRHWQRELAEVPAPPFGEAARSRWLQDRFASLGLEDVHADELGNVFGTLQKDATQPLVGVSAHLDTVFPIGTRLETREEGNRLYGPGISDNAAGVVAILAVASALKRSQLQLGSNVVFIGNVGEEGEGNLRGMRHIFASPRWKDSIHSLLVIDGAGTDTYVTQALGSRRFEVTFRGPGGHSWSDFGIPNPIVLLARALARFSEGAVPSTPRTTFNIGVIHGGTSVNSIPASATARLDLRSASGEELQRLEERLRECVNEAWSEVSLSYRAGEPKVTFAIESIGDRPAAELPADARIFQVLRAVDAHLRIKSIPRLASTDANVPLALGKQALTIGAGGDGGGAHTLREWFDCANRDVGLKRILLTLLALTGVRE